MSPLASSDVGPVLLGFVVGLILYGVSLLQTYQYFLNYTHDNRSRKVTVVAVSLLDSMHTFFSVAMVYSALTNPDGFVGSKVIWSMKGSAISKTFLIVLVQSFYLRLIWHLAGNVLPNKTLSRVIKLLCVTTFAYALIFLFYMEKISSLFKFSISLEKMIYIAFGSTVGIDSGIAVVMAFVLVQGRSHSSEASSPTMRIVSHLVTFFVASGFLTAVAAVLTVALYIARPSTILYLTVEFSVPKLYANSILAMFNAKSRLQRKMEKTRELKLHSTIVFGEYKVEVEEEIPDDAAQIRA